MRSGRIRGTPAIVLVHGIASSTENWDFSPTWSVARALAAAGYVVYSYDRLGYAQSSYFDHPGGGLTLTTAAHRAELHQIVGEVKTGGYTMTTGTDCAPARRADTVRSHRVVIIGHSAGGWIVAGYPGEYHDVAAMIQADINGSDAQPPAGTPAAASVDRRRVHPGPQPPRLLRVLPDHAELRGLQHLPAGRGRLRRPDRLHAAVPGFAVRRDHRHRRDVRGERRLDREIGPSIPVLLTSGEQDTTDPPVDADADYAYYKQHCGCDVSQLLFPNTAHLFMVHQSLPVWLNDVVGWLSSRGVRPPRRTPPVLCTGCEVRFVR